MDDQILTQRTEELVTEIYGQGNPVSEDDVAGLIRGLQFERYRYARVLAEAVGLTGMTVEQLTNALSKDFGGSPVNLINPNSPSLGTHYLAQLNHACKELQKKGYVGERMIEMLHTPIVENVFSFRRKMITPFEAIRDGQRFGFFDLPNADQS